MKLVGRISERRALLGALESEESEMVAVLGRRRIGKTFLIQQTYEPYMAFQLTGSQHGSMQAQLKNFARKLEEYFDSPFPVQPPATWNDAFALLKGAIRHQKSPKKRVIFFDELPWLATHKSGFLEELAYFWNDWLVHQNMVVVICGSAASWMIDKVILQKGSLHNRVTRQIRLKPFTLQETEAYLQARGVNLDRYQLIQLYMAIGGVAYYLRQVPLGMSANQVIEHLCFSTQGSLRHEFDNLYASLFLHHEKHVSVIRALAQTTQGLTRKNIVAQSGVPNGGGLTDLLRELEYSSFISTHRPFGKKKRETLYRLSDEFSLFYLRFMEGGKALGPGEWLAFTQSATYKAWSGYAFEGVCLKHTPAIVQALGIAGIQTQFASFVHPATEELPGVQIDLLIDRADQAVTLCEIKFYSSEFALTKSYAQELRIKQEVFRQATKTKKQLFWCMITTHGVLPNSHSTGLLDHEFDQDILFALDVFQ